jgi:hypothetical protein
MIGTSAMSDGMELGTSDGSKPHILQPCRFSSIHLVTRRRPDAPVLPHRDGERLALRWIGHRPSDEMTAMLAVNRARDWDEFRHALADFARSSQNFPMPRVGRGHLPPRSVLGL